MIVFIKYNISSVEKVTIVVEVRYVVFNVSCRPIESALVFNPGAISCPGGINAA